MTDYPDYQTPQAHATAIAGTGVPLLALAKSLFNVSPAQNVASGTTFTVTGSPFAITQIGYEAFIQVEANAASAFPFGRLTLTWADSVSGNVVATEVYSLAGGSGVFQQYALTGPTKGNQVTVTFHTDDPGHALQFQMTMLQNSRVFVRDDMRQVNIVAIPTVTNGNYDQAAGILLSNNLSVASAGTGSLLVAFYSGKAAVAVSGSVAFQALVLAFDGAISTAVATVIWAQTITAAGGGQVTAEVALPRCPCVLQVKNNGASTQTFTVSVILQEQLL